VIRLHSSVFKAIEPLRQRFEQLQPRERLLIILVGVALIWALAQVLYFDPANEREKQLSSAIKEVKSQIPTLEAREKILQIEIKQGPLASLKAKREELLQNQARLDAKLHQQGLVLMDTERMRMVLHDLLKDSNLELIALHRLPPELAFSPTEERKTSNKEDAATTASQQATHEQSTQVLALYRHPVQIELIGRYTDMLSYLERLEASPWRLMWQGLDIETLDYPRARMRLTVYTLSLEEAWIGV
jgi:MSHA biogenesis protein MshJ